MEFPQDRRDGPRVYLRPLEPVDINARYLAWFRDESVTAFLSAKNLTREQVLEHLHAGPLAGTYQVYAICHKDNDEHIGNVKVGPVDANHMTADLVTVVGARPYWGQGLAPEAIRLGIDVAFSLGIRKLPVGMVEGNIGSMKAYAKAGFVCEGRLVGQYLSDDGPKDRVMYSCFNPEFFQQQADGTWISKA